jgi:hypothetical protein
MPHVIIMLFINAGQTSDPQTTKVNNSSSCIGESNEAMVTQLIKLLKEQIAFSEQIMNDASKTTYNQGSRYFLQPSHRRIVPVMATTPRDSLR